MQRPAIDWEYELQRSHPRLAAAKDRWKDSIEGLRRDKERAEEERDEAIAALKGITETDGPERDGKIGEGLFVLWTLEARLARRARS